MDANNIQYYLYEDQSNSEDAMIVEENKLLKQLQEAVVCKKDKHSEDELSAAVGMMLMHYQVANEPEPKNKFAEQIQQQKDRALKPKLSITKTYASPNRLYNTYTHQIRRNRRGNYSKSSLLASCRNILKEFLSQNSF